MWPGPVLLTLHGAALLPISRPGPALLESEILTSEKSQPWRYKTYKVCGTYQLCYGEHTLPKESALKCGWTLQEAQRKRWRRPCDRLLDACQLLPHCLALLFPMYLLHLQLCKRDKEELHNSTFYRFVICVHLPTMKKKGKNIIPNIRVEKQIDSIAHLPDFLSLLACSLLSLVQGSLCQVFLELHSPISAWLMRSIVQILLMCTNNHILALSSLFLCSL